MESGSATTFGFCPTHRLAPDFLGKLTRDLIPHARKLSDAYMGRGVMVVGVNRHRPEMLQVRLECGTEVSVPEHDLTFAPTHWLAEDLLRQTTKNLQPFISLLKRGASQGVVLVAKLGGNGQARSRVRFATGDELEVPAWAVTEKRPKEVLAPPVANGKRKPPFVHRGGRFNGSRGR